MDLPVGIQEEALAQPTRARIYRHLSERRAAATTEEIAQALDLHPNGVRRHLERLAEAGLVERRRERAERGRPKDRWRLGARTPGGGQPTAYVDLARWLARAIVAGGAGGGERDGGAGARGDAGAGAEVDIEQAGFEIGQELAPAGGGAPAEVLDDMLSTLGFQPELILRADGGFTCKLRNCPYRDTASGYREVVCSLHRGITDGLLAKIDPEATLERFEPRDPERAGCLIEVGASRADQGGGDAADA